MPQIQFIDKLVDAPVSMQRQVEVQEQSDDTMADTMVAVNTGVNLNTTSAMTPHRLKAGMKEKAQDDGHEQETLYVSIASADEMEDEVEMESIDLRVTDMAHVGDLDARCLVQEKEYRQDVDELTDELVQVAPNMWQVAHTPRPRRTRKRMSDTRSGPESCARSLEWSSSWCAGKGSST